MGKCVVKDCKSRSENHTKSSGITFHTVPKNAKRRVKWVEKIRLLRKETDWIPTKSTVICSKHFRDQDKLDPKTDGGHVYLSNEAVPMLVEEFCSKNPLKIKSEEETMDEDVLETDEEIDELTETEREHNMRIIIQRLRIVSANRLRRIKSISIRNKRLEKTNKKLKEVIDNLKKHTLEKKCS